MKKIIVPVDFSEQSEYALRVAANLAQNNNAELLVLHMLEMTEVLVNSSAVNQQMDTVFLLKLAQKKFNKFLDKKYLKDIKVTPLVKHFKVFKEVNDIAKEHNADLIVMGSHGSTGVKELFIGSNAEKVIRNSQIPVFIIKNKIEDIDFKNIVYVSDFKEESISVYKKAKKMFDGLGIKINLLYINLPYDGFKSSVEIDNQISNFFEKAEGKYDLMFDVHIKSDYTIEHGVFNFANLIGADAIAIPTHGRKGVSHFFRGSISEDMANHSTLPVFTFKI